MKTLLLLLTTLMLGSAAMAQQFKVIKVPPATEPIKDSIIYQNDNAVIILDRAELYNYMLSMDTTLRNNKFNNRVFNHIELSHLDRNDMAAHYLKAFCYLADSANRDLNYTTDKMYMLWAEDGGILHPYVEEIIPNMLNEGKGRVIDRSSKGIAASYRMVFEPIDGKTYRTFRLNSGKEIFRESTFCVEQLLRH
ncbi:hypothetical protein [Chitinophaga vietnamensis]|uniref:hypothetical protein n=1 Tax=Chitinophaga vietnamensis TaxID=2593957 RepID=UPI00117739B0|nr:hypothetical protein [Chitinophaga vietnamensis]